MDKVRKNLEESAAAMGEFARGQCGNVLAAAKLIAQCLRDGGKTLICGNGGSAAQAQHFAAELVGRFERERVGWPVVALSTDTSILTSVGNDYGFEHIFARQVNALGSSGDVLVGISTSGKSPNVLKALEAANELGMTVIGLTGRGGGDMEPLMDCQIDGGDGPTYLIQEVHLAALHQICGLVEEEMAGGGQS